MQITKIALIQLYKILKVTKRCMQRLVICSSLVFVVPYKDMRGQYVQITKIRYLCFDFVHSRYTRMAGFGRREIELMQALCIYNIYIEYYSVPGRYEPMLCMYIVYYLPATKLSRECCSVYLRIRILF